MIEGSFEKVNGVVEDVSEPPSSSLSVIARANAAAIWGSSDGMNSSRSISFSVTAEPAPSPLELLLAVVKLPVT